MGYIRYNKKRSKQGRRMQVGSGEHGTVVSCITTALPRGKTVRKIIRTSERANTI